MSSLRLDLKFLGLACFLLLAQISQFKTHHPGSIG